MGGFICLEQCSFFLFLIGLFKHKVEGGLGKIWFVDKRDCQICPKLRQLEVVDLLILHHIWNIHILGLLPWDLQSLFVCSGCSSYKHLCCHASICIESFPFHQGLVGFGTTNVLDEFRSLRVQMSILICILICDCLRREVQFPNVNTTQPQTLLQKLWELADQELEVVEFLLDFALKLLVLFLNLCPHFGLFLYYPTCTSILSLCSFSRFKCSTSFTFFSSWAVFIDCISLTFLEWLSNQLAK